MKQRYALNRCRGGRAIQEAARPDSPAPECGEHIAPHSPSSVHGNAALDRIECERRREASGLRERPGDPAARALQRGARRRRGTHDSGIRATSMLAANSSRGRNGNMSSSGAVTIRPSGNRFEETRGLNGCSGSSTISQSCGPSPSRVSAMAAVQAGVRLAPPERDAESVRQPAEVGKRHTALRPRADGVVREEVPLGQPDRQISVVVEHEDLDRQARVPRSSAAPGY